MSRWWNWLSGPGSAAAHHPWTGMDAAALLAAWDAGQLVWTCRMADFGPGYEQAIQALGIEILRVMLADPFDFASFRTQDDQAAFQLWQAYSSRILAAPRVAAMVERLQPEAVQVSAAMNLAGMFIRNGYGAEMDKVPEARRILISKTAG